MADIRLKKITVEPSQTMVIGGGDVNINQTTVSSSIITGALVINGGLSINATHQSTSSTAGGCITVGGGLGVGKSIYSGGDIIVDNSTSVFRVSGISTPRVLVDSSVNKSVTFAPDGVNTRFSLSDTKLSINITTTSTNASSGALYVIGGVAIDTTADANSITEGGALTIGGGIAIGKTAMIGNGIVSTNCNTIGTLFTTGGNVGIGNANPGYTLDVNGSIYGIGISTGSILVSGNITASNIFASNITASNGVFTTGTVTNIRITNSTTTNSRFTSVITSTLTSTNFTTVNAKITTLSGGSGIFTTGVTADNYIVSGSTISYGISPSTGVDMSIADTQSLRVGSNASSKTNVLVVGESFATNPGRIAMNYLNYITFEALVGGVGTERIRIVSSGNIGIGTTAPGYELDCPNGTLNSLNTIATNGTITNFRTNSVTVANISITGAITTGSILAISSGNLSNATNTVGSITTTGGNVGIGTVTPGARLDISGSLRSTGIVTFTNTQDSINSSTGVLVLSSGGLSIGDTADSTSVTYGGSMTSAGGIAVRKSAYIGGVGYFTNTTVSSNYSTGSVVVSGGLTITGSSNSTTVGNGGGLTVAGGVAIASNMYIGGTGMIGGVLTLNASNESVNASTGGLVVSGGVAIRCTRNGTSITAGGGMTVSGGLGVVKDVYIGGSSYLYNPTNYYTPTTDLVNVYDSLSIKRFSLDFSSNVFSISRYNDLGTLVERSIQINSSVGNTNFNCTTPSTASNSASVIMSGGVSINATSVALNSSNGGALTVAGGVGIVKNLIVAGDVQLRSTTVSNDVSTGALLVTGGVGISGALNVLGDTTLVGNLTVRGTTTSVVSTNTVITDNVLLLNSGPTGSKDAGITIQRYQTDNDTGLGDVVGDTVYVTDTLPIQGAITTTQIKLSSNASASDNYYVGWWVKVTSGFSNNQVRKITAYTGSTRLATVSSAWTTQNPSNGDTVFLYSKPYVGVIYNETNDRIEFGGMATDPSSGVTFTDRLPIYCFSATCISTVGSTSGTSGALLSYGGVTINNTVDASSVTNGGTFMTFGGGSVGKTLYVGNTLYVNGVNMTPNSQDVFNTTSFTASNNQSSFANITGLAFTSSAWGFDIYLSARVTATTNLYSNFHIRGINKGSSFEIVKTYVGDDTGIGFSITSGGQLQYTTPNYAGASSIIFRWRALVT